MFGRKGEIWRGDLYLFSSSPLGVEREKSYFAAIIAEIGSLGTVALGGFYNLVRCVPKFQGQSVYYQVRAVLVDCCPAALHVEVFLTAQLLNGTWVLFAILWISCRSFSVAARPQQSGLELHLHAN